MRKILLPLVAILVLTPAIAFADLVTKVADGDTLSVMHEGKRVVIRLANVDAPEKKQVFGAASKKSLVSLCLDKEATYTTQTIDRYGRNVAVVNCGGVEVNREQVIRGMAWAYTPYNKDTSLPALQEKAKNGKVGLWRGKHPTPPWLFRSNALCKR